MTKNVGALDRTVRVVVGLAIVYWAAQRGSWWGLVGVALLASATVQFCPLYRVFGLCTHKKGTCRDGRSCCGGAHKDAAQKKRSV